MPFPITVIQWVKRFQGHIISSFELHPWKVILITHNIIIIAIIVLTPIPIKNISELNVPYYTSDNKGISKPLFKY